MAESKSVGYKKWATNDEAGPQKLPKIKELDAEFSELLTQKKPLTRTTARHGTKCKNWFGHKKCRTFFCRGKEHHRENIDTLKKVAEELSQLGGILGGFFSLYSSFAEQCACYG